MFNKTTDPTVATAKIPATIHELYGSISTTDSAREVADQSGVDLSPG
jgi:hypothetical protein